MNGISTHSPYYHRLLRSPGGATNSVSEARSHPVVGAADVTGQLSSESESSNGPGEGCDASARSAIFAFAY